MSEKLRVDSKIPQECCGCTACVVSCPFAAIKMNPDDLGFNYPLIDIVSLYHLIKYLMILRSHSYMLHDLKMKRN